MASGREKMKKLEAVLAQYRVRIEEKEKELSTLRSEMTGVQKAFDTMAGKLDVAFVAGPPRPRQNVKATVLSALREAGAEGTNASKIVEAAARRNELLQQNTVSSLLSRFKSDGILTFDGSSYRLKESASHSEGQVH